MKPDGFLEQVETSGIDGKNHWDDSVQHFGRPRAMIEVSPVVLAAGVVKQGEQTNYCQICTTASSDVESKSINPLPVAWPVDGMRSALKNGHRVFTNSSEPSLWRVFNIRKSSDSLSHGALLIRLAYKSYRR
jgi:hypothetical protein